MEFSEIEIPISCFKKRGYSSLSCLIFETIDQSIEKKIQMLSSVLYFLKTSPETEIKCVFLKG
jgi:hypothetical protein